MLSTFLWVLLAAFNGDAGCTILHFTASWCKPCQEMQPALNQLRGSGWDIRPIDTDRQRPLAAQFQVENIPTLVILSEGREVDRIVGVASHTQIEKRIHRAAARSGAANPALTARQAVGVPASSSGQIPAGPIVRGQSPGMPALPRAVANTLASAQSAVKGGLTGLTRGSGQRPPQLSFDQAVHRAAQATVRIRVDEGNTVAFGTGTIVDVRGDEALVLTCGHLFRDMQAGSQLSVDLFAGTAQQTTVPSELIDFSADDIDIGLISMRIPVMIEPVEILPRHSSLQVNQSVFSYGCDQGANPTRRDTRISRINRYLGAANVEIVGAPAVGRSGGGLFDEQGRLIGVCNAANANEDEGIYAAADVVYAQLERLNLAELFDHRNGQQAHPEAQIPSGKSFDAQPVVLAGTSQAGPSHPPRAQTLQQSQPMWPDESAVVLASDSSPAAPQAAKVICIVRDAQGNDRMVTINAPSSEFLERINMAAQP